jgi:hypothetical protein
MIYYRYTDSGGSCAQLDQVRVHENTGLSLAIDHARLVLIPDHSHRSVQFFQDEHTEGGYRRLLYTILDLRAQILSGQSDCRTRVISHV